MIHPNTRVKYINDEIGYGVFATCFIPKGTIVYVKDSLELEITPKEYRHHSAAMQEQIEKYSYIDEKGNRIISWDFAKYVNHCCDCNTMSTGYGFEIAIKDIQEGDEITDEYGIFNMETEMSLNCSRQGCRGKVCSADFEKHFRTWDEKLKKALAHYQDVDQPLLPFIDDDTLEELSEYFQGNKDYRSVYHLKYRKIKYAVTT